MRFRRRSIPVTPDGAPLFTKYEQRVFVSAARVALGAIALTDYRMLRIGIEVPGRELPVEFIFALGDRAEELNDAWLEVRRRHELTPRIQANQGESE